MPEALPAKRIVFVALVATASLIGGATILALARPSRGAATPTSTIAGRAILRPDSTELARLAGRTRGSSSATVTVFELSDFQCPYCRQFALQTFPQLDERYVKTGRVRWIFLNRPKPLHHQNAVRAAEYASCAASAGRFWELHDRLFAEQDAWGPLTAADSALRRLASQAGLDTAEVSRCLVGQAANADVVSDSSYAAVWGVGGVPAFNIGGAIIVGALPVAQFEAVLDSVLAASPSSAANLRR